MPDLRRTLLVMTCMGVLLASACRGSTHAAAPAQRVHIRLQLNWTHGTEFAGYYQAIEQGNYQAQGLDVELIEGGLTADGYVDPTESLRNGRSDFAILTFAEYQQLLKSEQHPVVLMGLFQISPVALFALQETGIETLQDIAGRRVAIISEPWAQVIHQALRNIGLSPQDIREMRLNSPDMTPFFTQRVDVWSGYVIDEAVEAQMEGYRINLIFPSDYGVNTYEGLLVTTRAYADAHPEILQGFVSATLQGWRQALNDPKGTAVLLERQNPAHKRLYYELSLDYLRPLVDTGSVPLGWIDINRWQQALGISSNDPAMIDLDMRYVERAHTQE
ncbi:MAG: hypothetical protein Fur0018_12610 [Anaerolineales bacterium]